MALASASRNALLHLSGDFQQPIDIWGVIEEASIQSNLGEFPTMRDQGDEMTFPHPEPDVDPSAEDDIRLSDGDAAETGGVLPDDEVPEDALPEVSLAEVDVTASAANVNDDPPNFNLNDDGLPDRGATVPGGYGGADNDEGDRVTNRKR